MTAIKPPDGPPLKGPLSPATPNTTGATLQPDQAVQQLVERALGGIAGKLSEAQRLELTAVLRQALENDPALTELRKAVR